MQASLSRDTVDLSAYPDLVVVLLGIKALRWRALPAILGIGRHLRQLERDPPDGLLAHESLLFGWNHVGLRQYWRDYDSLERFTRQAPHALWWRKFGGDRHGTGFWHELYGRTIGMEAIYANMPAPIGLGRFAPLGPATGRMHSSRDRLAPGPAPA